MDMEANLLNAMRISISEIFETMFYMPVEFDDKQETEAIIKASPHLSASLHFTGVRSGMFAVVFPLSVLKPIASAFMGVDDEKIEKKDLAGTICEIVNMISGNTLTMIGGDYHLELPEMQDKTGSTPKETAAPLKGRTYVRTLNGVFAASFFVE